MANKLCLDPTTRLFDCGMQSVVPISTRSRTIPTGFCLLHSHQMANKLCLDPTTRLFDCGMQSVVPISTRSRAIPTLFSLLLLRTFSLFSFSLSYHNLILSSDLSYLIFYQIISFYLIHYTCLNMCLPRFFLQIGR